MERAFASLRVISCRFVLFRGSLFLGPAQPEEQATIHEITRNYTKAHQQEPALNQQTAYAEAPWAVTRCRRRISSDLLCTPTMRSTSRPALSTSKVGMLRTLKRFAVAGFSSTFSLATRTRPATSTANSSRTGAIIRQGPHQGAHMSSNTGSGDCSTSAAKLASVTVSGWLLERDGAFLHRPQTGSFPCSIFSRSTRLFA